MQSAPIEIWDCPSCHTRVDISALGFFDKTSCPQCGQIARVHKKLKHFELKKVIGIGGMSIVLEAYDTMLGRTVAIKILNTNCRRDPVRVERFEKECRLLARVQHPNVVRVYTAGHARGYFFFAMELLEGTNLEFSVQGRTPTHPFVVLKMAHLLASGLKAAHDMGVMHRDLKPGNILLTSTGEAKLIDFGLALAVGEREEGETIWATPLYASPETLMQKQEDERADIYALGMTLRSILMMKDRFDHVIPPKTSEDWYRAKKILPPLAKSLPTLNNEICKLVDHMTCFQASARPQNYQALIQEIEDVMEILQAKVSGHYPWIRHRKAMIAAGSTAVLTLLLSFFPLAPLPSANGNTNSPHLTNDSDTTEGKEKAPLSAHMSEEVSTEKRTEQLIKKLASSSSSPLLPSANYLSYQSQDALIQLWSMELKWAICYLESGHDPLLEQLGDEIEQLHDRLEGEYVDSEKLSEGVLRLAKLITQDRVSSSDLSPSLGAKEHALDTLAQVVYLHSLESQGEYAQALKQLETLRTRQGAEGIKALRPQFALAKHRLEQAMKQKI